MLEWMEGKKKGTMSNCITFFLLLSFNLFFFSSRGVHDVSLGTSPPKPQQPVLLTESYKTLLGSNLQFSPAVQVVYKMEVPIGRAETFMAAYWKHESTLRSYCTQVSLCRAVVSDGKAKNLESSTASEVASDGTSEGTHRASTLCRACLQEGRADCCTEFVSGPLRRFKDEVTRPSRSGSDIGLVSAEHDPPLLVVPMTSNARDLMVSGSPETAAAAASPIPCKNTAVGGPAAVPATNAALLATGSATASPSKWKVSTPVRQGRRVGKRGLKFERRCRACDHSPLDHAREGSTVTTFTLYLDFKTRAAWESAFSSFDDVVSDAMKDCVARAFEPSVSRIVDERVLEPVSTSGYGAVGGGYADEDDDTSAASESTTADHQPRLEEPRRFFRFTLWRAQNLPANADGSPHTWIVQAKCGKSILTSSPKTSNDPVWKEHFHFKYKDGGRKLYLRIIAQDQPKLHEGRLKVRVSGNSRSRSSSLLPSMRISFQDDRQSPRGRSSSSGRHVSQPEGRPSSMPPTSSSWGRRGGRDVSSALSGPSTASAAGSVPSPRASAPSPPVVPDGPTSPRFSMDNSGEGGSEDLWSQARQWRSIKAADRQNRHGQMLVSLEMDVKLMDPRALHSVVQDEEPEGVNDVLPAGNGWSLFRTVEPKLETGDVVLFVGYGWVGSTLHKYEQRPWLHMGMVMVFPEYDMILVWEFAPNKSLEVSDKVTGSFRLNVQLTDINTKLRDPRYYRVAVRKLECVRTPEMMRELMKLKKKLEAEGFQGSLPKVVSDLEELSPADDLSALFSAELLAVAFRVMKLLPDQGDIMQYGPSFWTQDKVIDLQDGAKLLPCIHIERATDPVSRTMTLK